MMKLSALLAKSIIGQASQEASDVAKFPVETCHLMALCYASWSVGMNYKVAYYTGDTVPTNLFFIAEARSGEGKDWVKGMLSRGLCRAIEMEKNSRAKKRKDIIYRFESNNGGDDRKACPSEKDTRDEELIRSHDISHAVTDINSASFDEMLRRQRGWFVLNSTEQGLIDGLLMGSHTDGATNIDSLLMAFNAGYMETRRISRVGFEGIPHGGIGFISQPGIIEKLLTASGNRGLTQRFFMMTEESRMGSRTFSRYTAQTKYVDQFAGLLERIASEALREVVVMDYANLTTLTISDKGWDEIYDYKNKIEPMLAKGGIYEPAILSSMWSKVETFIMKVAATLAIINMHNEREPIHENVVIDAILIVETLFGGVNKIAEDKGIVGSSIEERSVLEYLEDKTRVKGVDAQRLKNALSRRKVFAEYQNNRSARVIEVANELVVKGKLLKQNIDGSEFYKFIKY